MALWFLIHGCAFINTKVVDDAVVENPRGAVFLQTADDGWFGTAHPITMNPAVLAAVFRGVHITAPGSGLTDDRPIFSDDDTAFLTPLMSTALSKATKRQVVGFRVRHNTETGGETTGGILYIQGRLLHLTFTHYRAQREQSSQEGMSGWGVPHPTALNPRQLRFVPESARRSNRNEQPDVTTTPPVASLVVEYEALPTWSAPASALPQPRHENASVPAPPREKETELETLKEAVRTLQRRLADLEGQTQKR